MRNSGFSGICGRAAVLLHMLMFGALMLGASLVQAQTTPPTHTMRLPPCLNPATPAAGPASAMPETPERTSTKSIGTDLRMSNPQSK